MAIAPAVAHYVDKPQGANATRTGPRDEYCERRSHGNRTHPLWLGLLHVRLSNSAPIGASPTIFEGPALANQLTFTFAARVHAAASLLVGPSIMGSAFLVGHA